MKQIRVCGLGDYNNYYSYFLYGIMEGAIRNGCWFRPVSLTGNSVREVEKQLLWFKPDIILCHGIFGKDREQKCNVLKRLRKEGAIVFYHLGDAKEGPRYKGDISDCVDIGLINHKLLAEFSSAWNIKTYHWPYFCFYQKEIVEKRKEFKYPVIFTGHLSDEEGHWHCDRTKFIKKLGKNIKVFPDGKMGNTRFMTAEVSSSANAVLGYQMEKQIPGYVDVRPFQYIGAGALFFQDHSPQMDQFFERDKHYVSFRRGDVKDFRKKWKYYVEEHKEKGNKIREEGFEYCQSYHSTKERMKLVLDVAAGKEVKNRIYLEGLPV